MPRNIKKEKIAIVMSGGGMQCVYSAGALVALAEHYNIVEPDICIAASGSAGTAAYYLARQYEKIAFTWMALPTDPKFISIFKRPIVDVDYLVDDVYKKRYPIDMKRLSQSKTKLFFAMIRFTDGKLVFLRTPRNKELYTHIRATLAAPFIYGKKIRIHGMDYLDGAFGATIHNYMKKAVDEGATTIILLANRTDSYHTFTKAFFQSLSTLGKYLPLEDKFIRVVTETINNQYIFVPPRNVNVITITPQKRLGLGVLGGKKSTYRETFNEGYQDAVNNPELEAFLPNDDVRNVSRRAHRLRTTRIH